MADPVKKEMVTNNSPPIPVVQSAPETVKVTVAQGHRITTGLGQHFDVGQEVEVLVSEVERLIKRGVVIDPSAKAAPAASPQGLQITRGL